MSLDIKYIIIIFSFLILFQYRNSWDIETNTNEHVKREWNVSAGYDNSNDAANMLARTNAIMIEFLRVLKDKYYNDEPWDIDNLTAEHLSPEELPNDIYNMVGHLLRNYDPDAFYENDPKYSRDTSYTVKKGTTTHLCLRRRDSPNNFVDDNVMLFVLLHESSHIANYNSMGHNTIFWEVFKFILHEAQLAKIYKPVDYARYPVDYCGLLINYQPLYDENLRELWKGVKK